MAAATRSWALAYLCIFHLPQQFGQVGNQTRLLRVIVDLASGLPCVWPRERLQHGLDAFDRWAKPDCNLDHLWILGLVSVLLPAPGELSFSPHLYAHDHHLLHDILSPNDFCFGKCQLFSVYKENKSCPAGKVGQVQDEPPVPLLQPDQARRPGEL